MTHDFKADAEKYAQKEIYDNCLRKDSRFRIEADFLAGAARGVEVGEKEIERLKKNLATHCGSGHENMGCGKEFKEWDIQYRCVDCDAAYHRHCLRKTCAGKADKEVLQLKAQLAEAEMALKEIKVMSISSEAEQRRNGIFRDWKDIARDYFSKRGAR